jgi:RHS repeat-associated protein
MAANVFDSLPREGVPRAPRPCNRGTGRTACPQAIRTGPSSNAFIPTGAGVGMPAPGRAPNAPVPALTSTWSRALGPLVAAALWLLLWFCPSLAVAREYASPPAGGGLVENPDGTWSFYGERGSAPLRTFTGAEHEELQRLGAGLELDTGTTGQSASVVSGIGALEVAQAEALAGRLRTGELFKTLGEAAVGSDLIGLDEAERTLPSKGEFFREVRSERFGPGPERVSDEVGAGLVELYKFPSLPFRFYQHAYPTPSKDRTSIRNWTTIYQYLPTIELYYPGPCKALGDELGGAAKSAFFSTLEGLGFSPYDECEWATSVTSRKELWERQECRIVEGVEECAWSNEDEGPAYSELTSGGGSSPFYPCPEDWLLCWHEGEGEESLGFFVDENQASPAAFPAGELGSLKTASEPVADAVSAQSALKTPVSAAEPRVGPTRYVEFLLSESGVLLPGIEGPGVGNPLLSAESEGWGPDNPGEGDRKSCKAGDPVDCASGNEVESQTDLTVGGRGPGLQLARTYNSQLAASQSEPGSFGYGWSGSYSAHLELLDEGEEAVVHQDNGSTTAFARSGEHWAPAAALVEATLESEGSGYVYTLPSQLKLRFSSMGRLTGEEDRDGNTLSMSYNAKGQLETVTDSSGRKLTFTYDTEGQIEQVSDPMGHTVKYAYEHGALASVTEPGEASARWTFEYNGEHELTSMTDGRGNTTSTEYDSQGQVVSQTDPLHNTRKWSYSSEGDGSETTITEPNGSSTVEDFNELGEPTSVTRAAGTSLASSIISEYNGAQELVAISDGDGHQTEYGYNGSGDLTSEKNADGDETKWTYDSKHDVLSVTTPDGETTTIKREGHGNPEAIERPAPSSKTQVTKYKYDAQGDLESVTNPAEQTRKYEYDSYGDRTAEIDPEGNKRTWEYNEDSQVTATVSPRGNAPGAEASKFTTKTERDAQGRPLKVTHPLGYITKYAYDGDGEIEKLTSSGHITTYTYDADDELTKVESPNGDTRETEYNAGGSVIAQTDGDKHTTKYTRNALEEITEVISPRERKTLKEYDGAGNLIKLTDPAKRTTSYAYDPANRLVEVDYSDGKTPAVQYEYDKDGLLTSMTDGTGTSKYAYDQLDRLTETENGHKETVKYEYNLAGEPTQITYPNGKAVTRAYDKDGRLEKVTDWAEHTTSFAYDPDSDPATITYPSSTGDVDQFTYNEADEMSDAEMSRESETLASIAYAHENDGNVTETTATGLPGEEKQAYEYDTSERLTKAAGTGYEYDAANDPTKIGGGTYKYSSDDELESGPEASYTYNEVGQRTKITPSSGPATTYGYDQAGNLTTVERPKEGATEKIEDSYTYNGNDLRASQTINGTTSHLVWDEAEELPLLLSDGTNSYLYGPDGLPIEQINNSTGAVTYLHHDQAGSTRLLTGSTGAVIGKCTYGAYGAPTCEGTTTTPLGYDGQYTSPDTGLIYMRAREYDPSTAQFLTRDPWVALTGEPYSYVANNPLTFADPTGRCSVWCVVGVVAGGVALATGVGEVAIGGGAVAEGVLGGVSVLTGAGATAIDTKECVNGSGISCVGAAAGAVATGGTGLVVGGFVTGSAASGATAIGLTAGGIGFLGDAAGAAASERGSESGCG